MTIVSHLSLYELLSKKEIIWMNAVKYRQRLKKDAWFKFRLGLNIRTSRQAQSGMGAKIYSWSTIHCGFKIRLSARKNPLSGGFSRPNLAIRKPIHRHIITCNRYQTWQRFVDQKSSFHLYHILWQQLTQRLLWSKRTNENLYLNSKEKKTQKWEQQLKSKTLCLAVLTNSTVPAALNPAISVTWPSLRMVRMTINRYQLSKLASYLTIKNLFCICLARLCIWSFSLKTIQKKFIYRDFPHDCQGVSLSGALNTWLYHSKKIK